MDELTELEELIVRVNTLTETLDRRSKWWIKSVEEITKAVESLDRRIRKLEEAEKWRSRLN